LADDRFSFLLFPVRGPHLFDSVEQDDEGRIRRIRVKEVHTPAHLIWGAFKMPGVVLRELFDLGVERDRADEYIGTLVNEWIRRGGTAWGVAAGKAYYDSENGRLSRSHAYSARGSQCRGRWVRVRMSTGRSPEIERRVRELGEWFQNMELDGVPTAPSHFLGDYPSVKFRKFAHAIPESLAGKTVLDHCCPN
jgi:tRNA (mo5U34)-methyltransferase